MGLSGGSKKREFQGTETRAEAGRRPVNRISQSAWESENKDRSYRERIGEYLVSLLFKTLLALILEFFEDSCLRQLLLWRLPNTSWKFTVRKILLYSFIHPFIRPLIIYISMGK